MKNNASTSYDLLKRSFDILGSIAALVISIPIFVLASLLIKLDGGPVFFHQQRVGRNGSKFIMLKFRTMVLNAQELEYDLREKHEANGGYGTAGKFIDPRITRVGLFLRRLNLDELPQFFNILKGDMSFVGPRPVPYEESLYYGEKRDEVLSVRPGLTGYWQIKRRMSTGYEERIDLDCYYIRNRNLSLDSFILLITPFSMFTSDYNSVTKPLPPPNSKMLAAEATRAFSQTSSHIKQDKIVKDLAA